MVLITEPELKNPPALDGLTPLHLAARNNHQDILEYILEFVVDKNPKDQRGVTPLHYAALNNHQNIVKSLLPWVDEKNPKDSKGLTPLNLTASKYGRIETARQAFKIWRSKGKIFN